MNSQSRRIGRALALLGLVLGGAVSAAGCGGATADQPSSGADARAGAADATHRADAGAAGPDASVDASDAGGGAPDAAAGDVGPTLPLADCARAALRTSGTVHYVCDCMDGASPDCVAGNDSNPGTREAPKQSLAAATATFKSMPAGDTVALCRGGAWNGNFAVLGNPNCRATNESTTCDLRDYVPQAHPEWAADQAKRPIVNVSGNGITMWGDAGASAGFRYWNLDLRWPLSARTSDSVGFFLLGTQNDIDICNVSVTNPRVGIQQDTTVSRLTTRSSTIRMCGGQGYIGAGNGTVIDSNTFLDNGDQSITGSPGQAHTIYAICGGPFDDAHLCTGVRITNNYIYTGPDSVAPDTYGACRGMMLALRGHTDGALIANNYIESSGPYGCGSILVGFSGEDARHVNTTVTRNRIRVRTQVDEPSYPNAGLQRADIAINTGEYVVVSDNVVWAERATRPISSPESTRSDSPVWGTIIRNNTVYTTAPLVSPNSGIRVGWDNSFVDLVVENNAVYMPAGTECFRADGTLLSGHPLTFDTYPGTATSSAGNYCMQGGEPEALWGDPANGDFRPAPGSPLIASGNSTFYSPIAIGSVGWTPTDPGVPRSPPIDIGAMLP